MKYLVKQKASIESAIGQHWSTLVNFKAFSRKSKLNPDYVMRYELSIKLKPQTSNQSCIEIFSNKRFKVTSVAIM